MTFIRLPRSLPAVPVILADLGHPPASAVARALGVSERSVWRWQAADAWPRPAHLALFFASRWGWSEVESRARYEVELYRGLAGSQARELAALRAEVERLARLAVYGSANDARA